MSDGKTARRYGWVGPSLAVLSLLLYWRSLSFDFFPIDDPEYILGNPAVAGGLSLNALKSAFAEFHGRYWIPVTWLSYAADISLFGLSPQAMHGVNVVLFALSAWLLYRFLEKSSAGPAVALAATALFALHPSRVESVAWIAERKDVLSGLFFLVALNFHLGWAREKKPSLYAASLLSLTLGLLSKPSLVVAPALLLMADFWPLERLAAGRESLRSLVLEKIPHFALSALFSAITLYGQLGSGAEVEQWSFLTNFSFASTGYFRHIARTFWPFGFTFSTYLTEGEPSYPLGIALWALLLIAALAAWVFRRRAPELSAGLGWFAIALFPVSGIVIVGIQPYGERFTYLPHMLFFAGLCGFASKSAPAFAKRIILPLVAATIALVFAAASLSNMGSYRNAESLARELKKQNPEDPFYFHIEGRRLAELGDFKNALPLFRRAVEIAPHIQLFHAELGMALVSLSDFRPAAEELEEAVRLGNGEAEIHFALGMSYATLGDFQRSGGWIDKAIALNPSSVDYPLFYAALLREKGFSLKAQGYFAIALAAAGDGPERGRVMFEMQKSAGR